MKNLFFSLATLLVVSAFFAFTWNPTTVDNRYEGLVEAEIKNEYLATASSKDLTQNLSIAFSHLLNKIDRVDIHQGEEHGYYYTVYGEQAGVAKVLMINVGEELASQEAFPTMEQLGIPDENLAVATCYWNVGIFGISVCTTTLSRRVCGYTVLGGCVPFDIINR